MNAPSNLRQRRFPRYACSYAIAVVDHAGRSAKAVCRSLSQGGFGATVSRDLAVGTIVSIMFRPLLIEYDVSLKARVLYHEAELYGFEFVAPAASQREAIAALFKEAVGDEAQPPAQ
jgi:hypothetical protein